MPSGKAFSTKFAIYCFDWKDEGNREERDEAEDSKQNIIPLMYEYVTSQNLKSSNDHDLSKETSIYKGGTFKKWQTQQQKTQNRPESRNGSKSQ